MHVTRLNQLDSCWQMAAAWDCMAHGNPFRRTAWLLSWWQHYQSLGQLYVLRVTDRSGQIVGIAPWYIDQTLGQGRVVQPLGSGNTCSEYLGVLTTAEHEREVVASLARWLVEAAADQQGTDNRWDLLDLVSVDARDAAMMDLRNQLRHDGSTIHEQGAMSCWRVELPESWDAYLATLGRSQRKRIRRLDRRWLESGTVRLRTVQSPDQLPRAMESLVRLHQQRQQSVGNPGCFADPTFTAFLHDAGRRMLADGTLRLHWIELGGEPIAAEFQLTGGDTTYAYLGGMSTEMELQSPGQLIQIAVLKQCIAQQQHAFDFLRGDELYKAHWGVREQRCRDIRVVASRHAAQLRHQIWLAGGAMKQWIRSGLHIAGMH